MARMAVVLPAPFGPSSTVMAPSGTSKLRSRSASLAPKRCPTPDSCTTGADAPTSVGAVTGAVAVGGTTATSDPNAGTGVTPVGTDGTADTGGVGSGPWYGGGTSAVGEEPEPSVVGRGGAAGDPRDSITGRIGASAAICSS